MEEIKWDNNYLLHIEKIDDQHKELVNLIQKLNVEIIHRGSSNKVEDYINQLENYATTHFSLEEDLMLKSEYPKTDIHIQQHIEFKKEINKIRKEVANPKDIIRFLVVWLFNHIAWHDKELGVYLSQNYRKYQDIIKEFKHV